MEYAPPCYTHFTSCHFRYNQRYTPQLMETVPNQVYAGQKINFWLNPANTTSDLPKGYEPFYYMKLGTELTDREGFVDATTRLQANVWSTASTRVGGNPSSKSVDPDINFSMFGRTFIRSSAKHCNFAGDDCWTVRVHPRVDGVSAASGYLDGGQVLKINGFGLSGQNISVKVDGVECLVDPSQSTDKTITCET
jgi:IPT/TIG domain